MSAGAALQSAIASAIGSIEQLTGVFDGPPARAAFPYAAIDASSESDWSHKNGTGREILVAVTVWDDQSARLRTLTDEAEGRLSALAGVEGWQLVAMQFLRRRVVRDVAGPWAAAIDFRARLLATD